MQEIIEGVKSAPITMQVWLSLMVIIPVVLLSVYLKLEGGR